MKAIESLGGIVERKILNFINKKPCGSHNIVVETWSNWTKSSLTLELLTLIPILKLRCLTASSSIEI